MKLSSMKLSSIILHFIFSTSILGCASKTQNLSFDEEFSPRVTEAREKQFDWVMSVDREQGGRGHGKGPRGRGRGHADASRPEIERRIDDPEEKAKRAAFKQAMEQKFREQAIKSLDKKMAETHFCHNGYTIYYERIDRGSITLRGECKDRADDAEMAEYRSDKKPKVIYEDLDRK